MQRRPVDSVGIRLCLDEGIREPVAKSGICILLFFFFNEFFMQRERLNEIRCQDVCGQLPELPTRVYYIVFLP